MAPNPPPGGSEPAFSLPEVLVALVIFAMAAVVLGSAYLNTLNAYEVVRRTGGENQDVAFAREQLLAQPDLQTAENGEEYDTADGGHVAWTASISPTNTTDLFSVSFTCELTGAAGTNPRKFTENFMLLRPTWSNPTDESSLRQAAANRIAELQEGEQP